MIKSGIFLGLYAAVGIAGWTAYDILNGKEPVLSEMGITENAMETVNGLFSQDKPNTTTLYQWKDANGQWHFGSEAPAGVKSQKMEYDVSAELEQMKRLPANVLPTGVNKTVETDSDSGFMIPGIPDMKQVAKLIKEATDVQSKADERHKQIEQIINN